AGDDITAQAAQLYRDHYPAALRTSRYYAGKYHDAEDLAQEAFVRVFNAMRRNDAAITHFKAYLNTTIRRLAMARANKLEPVRLVEDVSVYEQPINEHFPDDDALVAAFTSLPERWRDILWLRLVEDKSRCEAAALRDLTPAAAGMLFSRALDALRRAYAEQVALADA
ncbi:MAG: sigma-70 family RNA polymerase sigma factor, partial [Bifidobacteriaceae bacterium]|nr:sigma-70 family RNA polymerase sigma factor [Bifidobacteriaceae bacterium]